MKKQTITKLNNKYEMIIILGICLIGIILSTIFLETAVYKIHTVVYSVSLLTSLFFSCTIFKSIGNYLAYGKTRKEYFKGYIKVIVVILIITILFCIISTITKLIIYKVSNDTDNSLDILELTKMMIAFISTYLLFNSIMYLLSVFINNKLVLVVISFVLCLTIWGFNLYQYIGYYGIIGIVLGIVLMCYNYKITLVKPINL